MKFIAAFALISVAASALPFSAAQDWLIISYSARSCDPDSPFIELTPGSGSSICVNLATASLSFDTTVPIDCAFLAFQQPNCAYSAGDAAIIGPKADTCYTFTPEPPNTAWSSIAMSC